MYLGKDAGHLTGQVSVVSVSAPRCPQHPGILDWQVGRFVGKSGADPRVRVVFVLLPPLEHGSDDANDTGAVDVKIALECPDQEFGFLSVLLTLFSSVIAPSFLKQGVIIRPLPTFVTLHVITYDG